jgi:hypothetical protein
MHKITNLEFGQRLKIKNNLLPLTRFLHQAEPERKARERYRAF